MTETHHKSHEHKAHEHCGHQGKKKEQPLQDPSIVGRDRLATGSSMAPPPPDELTLYTEDGKWKAVLKAYKDYYFFYSDIGAEVDVYERRQTSDIWGHKTTEWVKTAAEIFMVNSYQGSIAGSPAVPQPIGSVPPSGGMGSFEQSQSFRNSHGEMKLWAAGFFSTKITATGEQTTPAGATLDIAAVVSEIEIATPSGAMRGTVGASSYLSDNSAWG